MTEGEIEKIESPTVVKCRNCLTYLKFMYCLMIILLFIPHYISYIIFGLSLIVSVICAITSLVLLKRCSGEVSDNGFIVPSLVLAGLFVAIAASTFLSNYFGPEESNTDIRSEYKNIYTLSSAFKDYASGHGGELPRAKKWNVYIESYINFDAWEVDMKYEDLQNFALNKNALDIDSREKSKMVLMFPSEPGKDQVGGVELLRKSGPDICYILLADLSIVKCHKDEVGKLVWASGETGLNTKQWIADRMQFVFVAAIFITIAMLIRFRSIVKSNYIELFALVLLAVFFGVFMGRFSERAAYVSYFIYKQDIDLNIGIAIGGLIGLPAGVCYCFVISRKIASCSHKYNSMYGYVTIYGAITGMIAGILTHLLLIYFYELNNYENIILGSMFGFLSGFIAGAIYWLIHRFCQSKKNNQAGVIIEVESEPQMDNDELRAVKPQPKVIRNK